MRHKPWMQRIGLFTVMLLATYGTPSIAGSRAAADVKLADRQYNRALERSDAHKIRQMLADPYVFTDPTGHVSGRDEVIQGIESGRIRITSQTTRDVRVNVFGDAAVESGLLTSVAVRDGHNSGGTFRFTRVWVKQAGRWKTAAIQETAPRSEP